MSNQQNQASPGGAEEFAREAERPSRGLVGEFVDFLKYKKKWWLVPILVALGFVGILVLLSSTAAAPFIYTLF